MNTASLSRPGEGPARARRPDKRILPWHGRPDAGSSAPLQARSRPENPTVHMPLRLAAVDACAACEVHSPLWLRAGLIEAERCRDRNAMNTDYLVLAAAIAILAFLWNLHRDMRSLDRDMRGLAERVAKLEGLLEGLRDAITGRTPPREMP